MAILRYKWRFTIPQTRVTSIVSDNRAMREAMHQRFPLIWFQGVASGLYMPVYPVYLADEEPEVQQFVVALDRSVTPAPSRPRAGRSAHWFVPMQSGL